MVEKPICTSCGSETDMTFHGQCRACLIDDFDDGDTDGPPTCAQVTVTLRLGSGGQGASAPPWERQRRPVGGASATMGGGAGVS